MAKTQKELAFLREFSINEEWTRRFTDLADKHLRYSGEENFLYINAGTGEHAFALREKIDDKTVMFAACESKELLNIAQDKAVALKADIDFSMLRFDDNVFRAVLADASFDRPGDLNVIFANAVRVAKPSGSVAIFLPAAGSFGEIFSLLWEVLFTEDLGEHGHIVEELINELPTASQIEEIAESAGLVNIEIHTAKEVFEYENGAAFVNSPLVADLLLPAWLKMLNLKERKRVLGGLAKLIDAEDGTLTFRFCVKVALVMGEKN